MRKLLCLLSLSTLFIGTCAQEWLLALGKSTNWIGTVPIA